jgi:hypothetical protein
VYDDDDDDDDRDHVGLLFIFLPVANECLDLRVRLCIFFKPWQC